MKREINPNIRAAMQLARGLARNQVEFVPMPVLTTDPLDRQKLVEQSKERLAKVCGKAPESEG